MSAAEFLELLLAQARGEGGYGRMFAGAAGA
jgi:hypothetical protein